MIDLQKAMDSGLSDYQFRLLVLLCLKEGGTRSQKLRIADLCVETRVSDSTVRRALQRLEWHGYLVRTKTKRANGYRGVDIYQILEPGEDFVMGDRTEEPTVEDFVTSDRAGALKEAEIVTSDRTHVVHVTNCPSSSNSSVVVAVANSNENSNTSYYYPPAFSVSEGENPKMVSKWDEDGDDLAGVGLTESRVEPKAPIKKNDPKTRGKRPDYEWTPADVAAEFSFLVGRKCPWLPGTVNVGKLAGALAKYRKSYQTSALIELELLRLFVADEYNFKQVGNEAPMLYKAFLYSFGTKMNQARSNLGLPILGATPEPVVRKMTPRIKSKDGLREYDDSMSGRMAIKRYEERVAAEKLKNA